MAIAILVAISSCKPSEKIIRTVPDRNVDRVALKNTLDSRKEHIKTLRFSKVKFDLQMDKDEFKVGGTIGLIKDSIIVVSIVPLMGYEMARIYCTKDSIIVINRSDKSFYKFTSCKVRNYKICTNNLFNLFVYYIKQGFKPCIIM